MNPDRYKVKVLKNLKVTVYIFWLLNSLCLPLAKAEDLNTQRFIKRLSNALNSKESSSLNNLFSGVRPYKPGNQYKNFIQRFPEAKWEISSAGKLKDGRKLLSISITDNGGKGENSYSLNSNQLVLVKLKNFQSEHYELISEESIFQTGKKRLPISINVPNFVLTGSKYDFDIILNKPLINSTLVAGIKSIRKQGGNINSSSEIELQPILDAGGLFKSIQAPLNPGSQSWAAVLAHQNGLISVTKTVKVVSTKQEMYN